MTDFRSEELKQWGEWGKVEIEDGKVGVEGKEGKEENRKVEMEFGQGVLQEVEQEVECEVV